MRTDKLIQALARDVRPVAYRAPHRRLGLPLLLGTAGSLALLFGLLGFRPDIRVAASTSYFWIKSGAMLVFLLAALAAVDEVARPESSRRRAIGYISVVGVFGMIGAAAQLAALESGEIAGAWLGRSSAILCPVRIIILSVPAFASIIWGFGKLAPTDLRSAGFFAGLLAGAIGAATYSLFCRSYSPAYIVTWYGLGIVIAGGVGSLVGPRILRW